MRRMIDDYISRFYSKEAARTQRLQADDFKLARQIVAWKENVAAHWDGIKVVSIDESTSQSNAKTGDMMNVTIKIDANGLTADDLGLECVVYRTENGQEELAEVVPFETKSASDGVITFELNTKLRESGMFRYAYRLYPKNAALPHRQDFAFVRWI